MNKKEAEELTDHMLVTDALIQLKALQDLLVAKGVFSKEEFVQTMDEIARKIAKSILKNANVPGDLDALVNSSFQKSDGKKDQN